MIQPNELRIGNWVKYKKYLLKLLASEIVLIEEGKIKCEPIPLTPEVLEKCDNVKRYATKKPCYFIRIDDDSKIELEVKKDFVGIYIIDEETDDLICLRGVEYLHQLQNLVFALTGEELEYKP